MVPCNYVANTQSGITLGVFSLLLEDDNCGSLTYYAFLFRMDGGAAQEGLIKKCKTSFHSMMAS